MRWLLLPGVLWTAPNTLLGGLAGIVSLALGARVQWQPAHHAWVFRRVPWGAGGAITLGNVILYTGEELDTPCHTYRHRAGLARDPVISLGLHERAHVYQYLLLGPLFLPLYFLCGGVSVRNRFERAADRYALTGRGWWPWSTERQTPP
ncbi:hypothetical protein [Dyella sp.]|uniref:hypothetical protein n=1 Tax=Dyella sp. TaxID=1869338 RepID=UPI002ED438DE